MDETKVIEDNKETLDAALKQIELMKTNTVSKEEFDKILDNNKKLIEQIAHDNKQIDTEQKPAKTNEQIIKECTDRYMSLSKGTSYDKVKALCDNYDAMTQLGLKVDIVDPDNVAILKDMIAKSEGNPETFKELCATRIKAQ